MTELYRRVLLWHKLVAQQTGGMALCSARHRLNRDEAMGWATALRNVADDIETFLDIGAFTLDDRGQRVVASVSGNGGGRVAQEVRHVENEQISPNCFPQAVSRKVGGLRMATRKK